MIPWRRIENGLMFRFGSARYCSISSYNSLATFSIVSHANSTGVNSWKDLPTKFSSIDTKIDGNVRKLSDSFHIFQVNQRTCQQFRTIAVYSAVVLMCPIWCVRSTVGWIRYPFLCRLGPYKRDDRVGTVWHHSHDKIWQLFLAPETLCSWTAADLESVERCWSAWIDLCPWKLTRRAVCFWLKFALAEIQSVIAV